MPDPEEKQETGKINAFIERVKRGKNGAKGTRGL